MLYFRQTCILTGIIFYIPIFIRVLQLHRNKVTTVAGLGQEGVGLGEKESGGHWHNPNQSSTTLGKKSRVQVHFDLFSRMH